MIQIYSLTLLCLFLGFSATAQSAEDEILSLNREMEAAMKANDLQKIASFYADDAAVVSRGVEISGREAVDAYWLNLKGRAIAWELENVQLDMYPEVAIQRGISLLTYTREGEEITSTVRFTLVWKKVNGEWKIAIDHYSGL